MAHGGARFTAGGPGGAGAGVEDLFSTMFGGSGGHGRFSAGRPGHRAARSGGGGEPNLEDLLGGLFAQPGGTAFESGYPGYGTFGTAGPRRGQDIQARTTLSFRDAVEGATVTLTTAEGGRITTRIPPGVKDGQKIRL